MNRYGETKKASILGILGNIFLLIIKGSIGIITKSQSMIADSANSAGDIFASIMTYVGNRIASEPRDDSHNFGHGKAEYIFSLFISISMIGIAIKLLYDSAYSLLFGSSMQFSWLLIVVCIITIIVKFLLFTYTNKLYKKYNNILLEANSKDHKNDCIVTTFTLISILATLINIYWLDSVVGIGISIWIAITGLKIFIESYNVLMDKSLDDDTKDLILKIVDTHSEIKNIDVFLFSKYLIVLYVFFKKIF